MFPRSLTINFPDGAPEYWITDMDFKVGDSLERRGATWTVAGISEETDHDSHAQVHLNASPAGSNADTYIVGPA
jgi:hypothetical protein